MIYKRPFVNGTAYMQFKEATDRLFTRVDHAALAESLGVSVALIRQSRLDEVAKAHRSPPKDWEDAVVRLAEKEVNRYRKLIDDIRQGPKGNSPRGKS
jgi:hypothetical protein